MTGKELLERPAKIQEQIFRLEEKAMELENLAQKCTSMLSPTPGGGHNDRRLEDLLVKAADLRKEASDLYESKNEAILAVTPLLQQLPNSDSVRVLTERYLELLSIHVICKSNGWCERKYYQIHARALKELDKVMEEICPNEK